MPRKGNEDNPLQVRVRAVSIPKRVSAKQYLTRLVDYIDHGKPIPESWQVDLSWINPRTSSGRTKHWQTDDFQNAIDESRSGFVGIVRGALMRQMRTIGRQ